MELNRKIFLLIFICISSSYLFAQNKTDKSSCKKKGESKTCCMKALPNRFKINESNKIAKNTTASVNHEGMKWIPGGVFMMGGDNDQARSDEFPRHQVKVDGFYMDETEVTNEQFEKFVNATHYITTAEKDVDWNELKKQLKKKLMKIYFCLKMKKIQYLPLVMKING